MLFWVFLVAATVFAGLIVWVFYRGRDVPASGSYGDVKACSTINVDLAKHVNSQLFDGVQILSGDHVLVRAQSITNQNGIYKYNGKRFHRAAVLSSESQVLVGGMVKVEYGHKYGGKTLILQIRNRTPGDRYEGIRHRLEFVTWSTLLLGDNHDPTTHQILQSDPSSQTGVSWVSIPPSTQSISDSAVAVECTEIQVDARSYKVIPIVLDDCVQTKLFSIYVLLDKCTVVKGEFASSVNRENKPCISLLSTSTASSKSINVRFNNLDGTQKWWSAQDKRGVIISIENGTEQVLHGQTRLYNLN